MAIAPVLRRTSPFVVTLVAALASCAQGSNEATEGGTSGDGGAACPPLPLGEGGCVMDDPAVGACCTPGEDLCPVSGSNPCCVGYTWTCQDEKWAQEPLGCACPVSDSGIADSRADAPAKGVTCGGDKCAAGDVCVVTSTASGPCEATTDAGGCPKGAVKEGACCKAATTTRACKALPAACKGALTCGCDTAACAKTDTCSVSGSTLTCVVDGV